LAAFAFGFGGFLPLVAVARLVINSEDFAGFSLRVTDRVIFGSDFRSDPGAFVGQIGTISGADVGGGPVA
jgi:hypothetical protein